MRLKFRSALLAVTALISTFSLAIENAGPGANNDPTYVQLRHVTVAPEAYEVHNLKIVRDVGTFELSSGTVCLLSPVQGQVTGAVFRGTGTFQLQTKDARELRHLKALSGELGLTENFERLVLRFADSTGDEIAKSASVKRVNGSCPTDLFEDSNKELRFPLRYNVSGRLLQPVLSGKGDGFFMAFIRGQKYADRTMFVSDPQGLPQFLTYSDRSAVPSVDISPDQVTMFTYNDMKFGIWYGGNLLGSTAGAGGPVKAVHHNVDATFEKSGFLNGVASTTFSANVDGVKVVPLDLFWKLRVHGVTDAAGTPLAYIQEEQRDDIQYFVILPKALAKGEQFTVKTTYSGKDAVTHEGSGNYYPIARENWYPNTRFGNYATYELTLRVPKGNVVAATGTMVSTKNEGAHTISVWKSDVPMSVAGFNFGTFKQETAKLDKIGVTVTSFANREIPDKLKDLITVLPTSREQGGGLGVGGFNPSAVETVSTTPMLKKALAEAQLSELLYTDFFGASSFTNLQVTQQTAWNYGQSWPGLVFMPIPYFLDTTQRHSFGWNEQNSYFRVVEPHEVAHQWWGHSVGFDSYRDQWMSEGFSDFSASLFLQLVRNDRNEYLKFWKDERRMLLDKNEFGIRAIDAGPLSLGHRVNSGKQGFNIYRELVYPKGAYVLHMLRMMMLNPKTGDADFKALMHDVVNTYRNRPMTTEDFKHMIEKHMPIQLNATGDGKMDWFFDEWVYGTEIPSYTSESNIEGGSITLKVTQSGVSPNFRMVVPVYFELADGKVGKLGQVLLVGNQTISQTINLGATTPKRLFINYNYDVLTAN